MKRRQYLILSCGVGLTGCSSLDSTTGSSSEATPTSTPTETSSTPTQTEWRSREERHYKVLEIGSLDNVENPKYIDPHEVVIVNVGDSTREFVIHITAQYDDSKQTETVLDANYEVPNGKESEEEPSWDNSIYIGIIEPATYTIDLQIPAEETGMQFTIQQEEFSCNRITHTMSVQTDSQIELTEDAEAAQCSTPDG